MTVPAESEKPPVSPTKMAVLLVVGVLLLGGVGAVALYWAFVTATRGELPTALTCLAWGVGLLGFLITALTSRYGLASPIIGCDGIATTVRPNPVLTITGGGSSRPQVIRAAAVVPGDGGPLRTLVRHYRDHPQSRAELTGGRAADRLLTMLGSR